MKEILTVIVQWCHVAGAILWVGGAAFLEIAVGPVLSHMPPETERSVGKRLTQRIAVFFAIAGSVTIVFGILRATLFGPITSIAAVVSPYGLSCALALAIAVAMTLVGAIGIGNAARAFYESDELWLPDPDGSTIMRLDSARRRLRLLGTIQLFGFALIVTCMLLMSEAFS